MSTLADMKTRIAQELRRDDLTTEIANAISTAIMFHQYERFNTFNTTSATAAPANDSEANNPWMNAAEEMIRNRAKALLYAGTIKQEALAKLYASIADSARQQLKISNLFQALANYTPGTLGYMKAKIANEIERGDLTNEVAAAVATAVGYYQNERFFYSETRDITFNTVANQYLYTSTDVPALGSLIKIDYIFAYIGGQPYRILPLSPDIMEWGHRSTSDPVGQPFHFSYYARTLSLYPTPDQAYPIRMGGQKAPDAPASDGETNNVWMTIAESMVRSRAKFELYAHIPAIMDPAKASAMKALADDAFKQLKEQSADLEKVGDYVVEAWGY
ncbi:MAG: hypothetical protein JSS20_17830 [Proteobacteria bacterium]|nr:hypothetical protein [Pseudomonadota bacterium]